MIIIQFFVTNKERKPCDLENIFGMFNQLIRFD